jgi:chromosome segregation ATPase
VGIAHRRKFNQSMDQELLKTNLNGLERKIMVLVTQHNSLKEELKGIKGENQQLKAALKSREEQIAGFHNQLKITKIVDNLNPEDGSVLELKKKVDEYIREIDKCIAHLSR